jgi:hypothetical protein
MAEGGDMQDLINQFVLAMFNAARTQPIPWCALWVREDGAYLWSHLPQGTFAIETWGYA